MTSAEKIAWAAKGPLDYETARELAADPDVGTRCAIAGRRDVAPEILYFLAEDADPVVRRVVAANPAAPSRANLLLTEDADEETRELLATKIARSARDGQDDTPRRRQLTHDILDKLSRDRLDLVRAAIADGLKDFGEADPALIERLARDLAIMVSAPVLEHSPLLSDEVLLRIISENPVEGALAAIARRAYVAPEITRAIVASGDSHAVTHLLYNANAHLQEDTLDALVAGAGAQAAWHQPLVNRPELAEKAVRRLAEVVADHLLDRLMERADLSVEARAQLSDVVSERLRHRLEQAGRDLPSPFASEVEDRFAPLLEEARADRAAGHLAERDLMIALLTDNADRVAAGLAVLSGQSVRTVLEILGSQSPRAMMALAWAAGLTPRLGVELQVRLGRVAQQAAMKSVNGAFPMKEVEMRWQIEMYAEG